MLSKQEKVQKKDKWRGVGCYLYRGQDTKDRKHFHQNFIFFMCLCDFLFDPVFVQSISISECWRCGCTCCLSTAHTTSVENGQCVLRLILYTLQGRARHRIQTQSVTSTLHSSIFSHLLYFDFDMRIQLSGVWCETDIHLFSKSCTILIKTVVLLE